MHTQLLNMGFIKKPDGTYINNELGFSVKIVSAEQVEVLLPTGNVKATLVELEEAMLSGGFGTL